MLTVGFVMLAEVLIFVPSIARFRADFLTMRLEKAQIAALAQLAAEDMVTPALEKELLANAEVYNVVLRRDEQTVRADVVTWNRKSGLIEASGNIRFVDDAGNVLYTDKVELTDALKAGAIEDMLLVLRQGGRLARAAG